jgi:hypothetical protein
MTHPVAPGKEGYNLLSKRHLFRITLLKGSVDDSANPINGPLVLESEDGDYRMEMPLSDAIDDGEHLVFDFYVKDRDKPYRFYFEDQDSTKVPWSRIPRTMGNLKDCQDGENDGA